MTAAPRGVYGQGKVPKAALKYQDQPKNGQRCSACVHFVSGGQCKIVEGQISPEGWCTAYTPKLAPAALADERIAGIVRDTVVTHCDATRRGGCAGSLILERTTGGRPEMVRIDVPLGTPISRAGEHVLLHALEGMSVIVTRASSRGRAALAIQVEAAHFDPAAGSTARDLC